MEQMLLEHVGFVYSGEIMARSLLTNYHYSEPLVYSAKAYLSDF
jgi:hypothetical protein